MKTSRTNYNLWTIILFFVLLMPKIGVGQSPIAVNDTFYTFKGTPLTGNLVNNDIDFSGNGLILNVTPITTSNHGTIAIDPSQSELTYTPNTLFVGIDSFNYEVCSNGIGLCDTGTVYINVVNFFMSGTVIDASNCILSDGNITVHSTADTINAFNAFEYSIDGGNSWQDSTLFTNLAVGNYTIIGREKEFSSGLNDTINLRVSAPNIPVIDSIAIVSPSYYSAFNGQISISATGNNLIYSIYDPLWQLNPVFNNLSFGTYLVQVKDQITQCIDSQIVQIVNSPNQIIANNDTLFTVEGIAIYKDLLSNDIDSIGNGLTISSLLTYPSNGNFIYHPNGSFNYWPNYNFTGVDSFQYVISAMGLPPYDTATVYIHVVPFQVSATVNNYGCNNNRITIHNNLDSIFSTSNLNLEYSIDSGHTWQTNPVFWVSNGTHQIMAQDISGAGLLDTVLVTISGDTPPTINALNWVNPVTCSASDGSITITATGTGLPIEYSITNGLNWQSSPIFNNLTEGFYDIRIRNNNGTCPVSYINNPVQLASINPITITNISTIAPTRCDTANGSINITATTTTGNSLEYSINNGSTWQSSPNFPGLYEGGYYQIVVREINTNNCWVYHPNKIIIPTGTNQNPITIDSIQYTNPTDCGVTDGTITVYATSNTLPYSLEYSIDNGINYQSSNIFTGLQGNYNYPIIVRNINGTCPTADTTITLTNKVLPVVTITTTDPSNCGNADGTITITAYSPDGTPIEYSIDNGSTYQSTPNYTGLPEGYYEIRVRNVGGACEHGRDVILTDASSTLQLSPSYTGNTTCVDGTTDIQLFTNDTGSVATYTWTGPNNYGNTVANPILTNVTAANSGTYYITVVDTAGCSKTDSIVLNITDQPDASQLSVLNTSVCLSNTIILMGNSYAGFGNINYNWWISDSSLLPVNTQLLDSNLVITPNNPGIINVRYSVTIDGCTSHPDSVQITILPDPIIDSVTLNGNPNCVDGNTTLQLLAHSSNTGTWSWTGPNGAAFATQNIIIPNATSTESGLYTATLTDFNGCQTTANQPINITDIIQIDTVFYSYDTAVVIASSGTGNYQYSFDCGATWQSSSVFYPALAGSQCIGVRNASDSSCTTFVNPTFNSTSPVGVADTLRLVADLMNTGFNANFNILNNDYDLEANHLFIKTDSLISSGVLLGLVNNDGTVSYTPTTQWMQFGNLTNFSYEVCEIYNPTICDTSSITVFVRAPYDYTPDFIEDTIAIGANRAICMPLEELKLGITTPDSLYFIWNNLSNVIIDSMTNNQCLYLHGESYGTDTTYVVITDDYGFSDTITLAITIEDGVWPGDTDDDTQVDNFDLLNIGLGYGSTGTNRDSISIVWDGFITPKWNIATPSSNVDYRHLDCNGDGIINASDTMAIIQNWGSSYQKSGGGSVLNGVPIFIPADTNYSLPHFSLPIMLGNMSQPAIDVYGGAFSVSYDTNYIQKNSVFITFDSSWVGTLGIDMISIERNDPDRQQVDAAFTRINAMNITGFGQIAKLNFTIKDDILQKNGFNADSVTLHFDIFRTKFIKYSEEIIDVNEKVTNMVITKTKQTPRLEQYISVFPNPVTHQLHINSGQLQMEAISLINVSGQVIHQEQFHPQHTHTLPVHTYSSGVYLLRIQTKQGVVTKRITIVR